MGTKYTIEVEDKPFELLSEYGFTSEKLYRVKGFNSLVFDWNGLNKLTPYTEPDLEQVRKEAYDRGHENGYSIGYDEGREAGVQQGLSDAWECARKIANMPYGEEEKVFGSGGWKFIINHTASEAIEKIRQYEQGQEEIKVGDEVKSSDDEKYIVLQKYFNSIDELMVVLLNRRNGEIDKWHLYNADGAIFKKTGRHFPEIASALEKMREGQEQ